MNILLIPIGSAGDVYPFLGIGAELQRRGHRITLITNGYFEPLARQLGFDFAEFGSRRYFLDAIRNRNIWHPTRGFRTIVEFFARQDSIFEQIAQRLVSGQTLLVSHTLAFAARIAQEKLGVPNVTLHTAPAVIRSEYQVPTIIGRLNLSGAPRWAKRLHWWLADKAILDPLLAPPINALRAKVGLAPVSRIFHQWMHSPLLTIGLFPEWFCPPQRDWPPSVRLSGFPLYDTIEAEDLPSSLNSLLCAGDPPVVFTPGSANVHAQRFFQAAIGACQRLGRRGLLLTRFPEQIPAGLPPTMLHVDFAPLSRLLPRCAALVHHGGIGTTAAALAAGIPQIVMPMSHDQPDNAARIVRLGVGGRIMPRSFRPSVVAGALRQLLDSETVRERCRHFASLCREMNGIDRTCDLIESAAAQ